MSNKHFTHTNTYRDYINKIWGIKTKHNVKQNIIKENNKKNGLTLEKNAGLSTSNQGGKLNFLGTFVGNLKVPKF